ncbi:hypothetical protein NQZ68_016399 [Dissostichus eleginoides]|nr:hypothetical protein NQZ68_016399 [Dissostichus eleginoides]
MAAASVTPKIVKFGFKDYVVDDANKKRTAVCRVCSMKISDTTTTTSNFIRHNKKTHRERATVALVGTSGGGTGRWCTEGFLDHINIISKSHHSRRAVSRMLWQGPS